MEDRIAEYAEELGNIKYRINDVLNGESDTNNLQFEMGKIFQRIDTLHNKILDELHL